MVKRGKGVWGYCCAIVSKSRAPLRVGSELFSKKTDMGGGGTGLAKHDKRAHRCRATDHVVTYLRCIPALGIQTWIKKIMHACISSRYCDQTYAVRLLPWQQRPLFWTRNLPTLSLSNASVCWTVLLMRRRYVYGNHIRLLDMYCGTLVLLLLLLL
jgi:hypothetical protein